ncbi:serine/threonine-protein kinase [Kitasatospora sp. NPDC056138]|uniref:serine/threonine-protein kinase n=1 Tax=Kitasatospora sp. NPDC056138 TaxID=3345724 RepID=UPI0035D7FE07
MARKIGSRYTVHQVIGRGSAGTVWLGEGPDGPVAVKLLREDLASDQVLVGRFVQERTALTSLDHPRVVGVHDMVVDGSDLALVMELVQGTDLRTRLERDGVLTPRHAVSVIADVADGLAAAHAAGIVHRDVKPENVLLDLAAPPGPGGAPRAKLTDFGIARLVDAPRRTRATRIIGTPDYLAPEIIEGLEPRAAVDIYALATVLYEVLAGFTPFGGGHTGAVLRRHVTESVPPVPGLPDGLWRIIAECLAKAPASRLRAAELAERLRDQLPVLDELPALAVPAQGKPLAEEALTPGEAVYAEAETGPGTHRRRRGPAVPLVPGPSPDSTRDTHTSLRRPSPHELASYAAESDAQRSNAVPAAHRKGRRALVRRRRTIAVLIAVVLLLAGAAAAFAAFAGGGGGRGGGREGGRAGAASPVGSVQVVPSPPSAALIPRL